MPSAKNVTQIKELEEKVKKAKSSVFTNYSGLTVAQQTKLRAQLKEGGGEFVVAKNTLLSRVFGNKDLEKTLQGQTGVVFSYDDEIGGIKKVVEFAKTAEKPEIKLGWMNGKMLSLEDIKALAKLPGKLELISTLISRLQGPAYGLVNVLSANARNLVYALKAIQEKKK
jgi:large subunit ribosomal protein L10